MFSIRTYIRWLIRVRKFLACGLILTLITAACTPLISVPPPEREEPSQTIPNEEQLVGRASVENLAITIKLARAKYGAKEPINLIFILTNTSDKTVNVLPWHLPINGLDSNMFLVKQGNKRVDYLGFVVKRAAPRPEDYLSIGPRASISSTIALEEYYAIYAVGDYSVQFVSDIYDVSTEAPAVRVARAEFSPEVVNTRAVTFTLTAERTLPPQSKMTPGYKGCSVTQKADLNSAINEAETLATNARNILINTLAAEQVNAARYRTWFGLHTQARYARVLANFSSIKSAFSNKTVTINCSCAQQYANAYAYVNPSAPYEIYVCGAFWNARLTGTDSRSGTLVHEMSHFTIVSSTEDYAYGQTTCQTLATKTPDQAIHNADSHEYFAENTPTQAMGTPPPSPILKWVGVEIAGINSHQRATWCPAGSFLVSFDLDGDRTLSPYDSPVVRQAQCARSTTNSAWGSCSWVPVWQAGLNSHAQSPIWCPAGSFLVGLDLDGPRNISDKDSPVVGAAQCCTLAGSNQKAWNSSYWIEVGAIASHNSGPPWCLDGAYLTQVDQDQWGPDVAPDAYDAPIVGQARCSRPAR